MRAIAILLLLVCSLAQARQDPQPMIKAVERFLQAQTHGLPGQASFTIGKIDGNNQLTPCTDFEVSLPPGSRLWGRGQVIVRCQGAKAWSLFVPVHVSVRGDYLVAARALSLGQAIQEADLDFRQGDLTDLPAGILTEARQAVGLVLLVSIPKGRPLRGDMLRKTVIIQQNQSVKLVTKGPGFAVSNEGRALTNAVEGQVVQVRLGNGQIISGIARAAGLVEISF